MLMTYLFLGFLIAQRLVELAIAQRNTRALLSQGATEFDPAHYPLIVAVHVLWIAAILVLGWDQPVQMGWLAAYVVLQLFRVWILQSLGKRWTTRIIILDEPLVRRGPYRYIQHPNYVLVVAEIFVAPMVLGLIYVALVFSLLNAAVLFIRIRAENAALATIGQAQSPVSG